ncbi:Protein of unknown function, partial [Cotesia congregata]
MTQRAIVLLLILISISTAVQSNNNIKVVHSKNTAENQERNSPALNNFLREVLSAKNELKWIDQMIYPHVNNYKYRKTRRRLLATRNGRSVTRKNYWSYAGNSDDTDDDDDYQEYFDATNMLTNSKKSFHAGGTKRRRFNLDDNGLENDDCDSNEEKCEPVAHRGILIKKMNNKTKYVEPKTVFLTPENLNSQKISFKRNSLRIKNDLQNDEEGDNDNDYDDEDSLEYEGANYDDQLNGREARYHRDQDHEAQLALEESNSGDDNQKYKRTAQDDDIFNYLDGIPFDLSSPEVGNTSSSGSDYHALKATDDMFKGGIEQGNSIDDKIDAFKKIAQADAEKTNPPYVKKTKWYSYLKLSQRNDEKLNTSTDKKVEKKQESREKRLTVNDMPIMGQESIVEPSNWPWEYYDDKDDMRIKFGRGLMQVSNEKFSRSVKKRKKMRSRNSFKNLKFINSTNPSHSLKKSNFRLEHKRLKNHFNRDSFPDGNKKQHYNKKFQLRRFAREAENKNEDKDKDVSQIHFRTNGLLADEIVDKIFEEVDQNDYLKNDLTFQRSNKTADNDTNSSDNTTVIEDKTVETMRTVKELLQTIIMQELEKKTCMKLPKCLEDFLIWLVEKEDATDSEKEKLGKTSNVPEKKDEQRKVLFPVGSISLPLENSSEKASPVKSRLIAKSAVKIENTPKNSSNFHQEEDLSRVDFLFGEMHGKMKLLKRLLKAYHLLTFHEQRKVKAVHDYLRKQLKTLEKFEELKDKISNFPTLSPINKMSNKLIISTDQNNSTHKVHDNDNSLLSLFSRELTNRNKLRDLKEKSKKIKKQKFKSFLNDNFRKKRAMIPNDHLKIIERLTLPLSTTASNDLSMTLEKFSSSIYNSEEIKKWNKNVFNESTEVLAYPGDKSKIKCNEYALTRAFSSSASTSVPSAPVFRYNSSVKRNRLMINNKNNQIKKTSIALKNLMINNEITAQLNLSNGPTTSKNSLATLESAKLLESKINIFPVDL